MGIDDPPRVALTKLGTRDQYLTKWNIWNMHFNYYTKLLTDQNITALKKKNSCNNKLH
jgi:hypothetical protein